VKVKLVERIWMRKNKKVKHSTKLVYDLAHFRNLTLIFIRKYHEKTGKWVTSASILYTLIAGRVNRSKIKNEKKVDKLREIESNLDEELKEWLDKMRKQKKKVDNNYLIQQVLRQIEKDFRSYFNSMKEYHENPDKFTGKPELPKPKKLKNLHSFTVEFNANVLKREGKKLKLRLRVNSNKWITVKLPHEYEVKSVRLCYFLGELYVDVVRDVDLPEMRPISNYKAGIDPNLDNLLVVTSTNPELPSIIISGKEIKAFNQWFNKLKSKYQSEHDKIANEIKLLKNAGNTIPKELIEKEKELRWKIRQLCIHRKKWFDSHFHRLTKYLALLLYYTGHNEVVIGNGALNAKRCCNLSSKVAEKFVQIPFRSLIDKLKYKCESLGIKVREVSEEFTSKISCLTGAEGKRIERGLFKDVKLGKVFNADCNGSFNILRRGAKLPRLTKLLDLKTLFKKLCNPVRFGFFKFIEFVQSVIPESSKWRIGDSLAPLGAGFNPVALIQSFQNTLFDNKRLHCYATG